MYKKAELMEIYDAAMPQYANFSNIMLGGKLLELIDKAAGMCAAKYAESTVVTASVEMVDFIIPIQIGNFISIKAKIIFTGKSSMLVKVIVHSENVLTGISEQCCKAYLNMVKINNEGKAMPVPTLLIETDEDTLEWQEGEVIHTTAMERLKRNKV